MREVQAPDGRVWRVRRCWLPRRRWAPPDDAIERGGLSWWRYGGLDWMLWDRVVYPVLILAGDMLWFLASIPVGVAARLLHLRSWRIRAATIGKPRMTREVEVRGWRRGQEAIDEHAAAIASGR